MSWFATLVPRGCFELAVLNQSFDLSQFDIMDSSSALLAVSYTGTDGKLLVNPTSDIRLIQGWSTDARTKVLTVQDHYRW
jgi:hypothetical protein